MKLVVPTGFMTRINSKIVQLVMSPNTRELSAALLQCVTWRWCWILTLCSPRASNEQFVINTWYSLLLLSRTHLHVRKTSIDMGPVVLCMDNLFTAMFCFLAYASFSTHNHHRNCVFFWCGNRCVTNLRSYSSWAEIPIDGVVSATNFTEARETLER